MFTHATSTQVKVTRGAFRYVPFATNLAKESILLFLINLRGLFFCPNGRRNVLPWAITSFQSSELTELSPPFKVFTVAVSCLPASRDHCVVLGARGFAQGGGVANFDGLLPRSSGGGEGLLEQGGSESALGMAKEMDSTLHCRFTTFTASWKYSKWTNPSGANPTTVVGTRTPLERV